jgi:hypothetical protein
MHARRVRLSKIEPGLADTAFHISALHKDLLAFRARMEQRFDRVLGKGGQFDRIDGEFDRIERGLRGLRADLPKVVRRAYREVLRELAEKAVRTK